MTTWREREKERKREREGDLSYVSIFGADSVMFVEMWRGKVSEG